MTPTYYNSTFDRVVSGSTVMMNVRYPDGTFIKKKIRLQDVKIPVAIHKYARNFSKETNVTVENKIREWFSLYGYTANVIAYFHDILGRWLGDVAHGGFIPNLATYVKGITYKDYYWTYAGQVTIVAAWYRGETIITQEGITLNNWVTWGNGIVNRKMNRQVNRRI